MERIFVVEDDESIREELKTLLEANGYKAVDAPPCDLALLDVNLPGENGFEICRKLRMHSDVPVIFLTARDSAEDEIVGFGVGADDYIRKPYNSSVLLMRIARLLKRQFAPTTVRGLTLDLSSLEEVSDELVLTAVSNTFIQNYEATELNLSVAGEAVSEAPLTFERNYKTMK